MAISLPLSHHAVILSFSLVRDASLLLIVLKRSKARCESYQAFGFLLLDIYQLNNASRD